jgi:hypothetical protein
MARCLSKAIAGICSKKLASKSFFLPIQFGVCISGGNDIVCHVLNMQRKFMEHNRDQHTQSEGDEQNQECILAVDFRNAFNSIHRSAISREINEHLPEIASYFNWSYGHSADLCFSDGTVVAKSARGVRQGDPLGSLLFALGLHPVLRKVSESNSVNCNIIALHDDVYIYGQRCKVIKAFKDLIRLAALIGLECNMGKCSLFDPWSSTTGITIRIGNDSTRLSIVKDGLVILGGPMGIDSTSSSFLGAPAFVVNHLQKVFEQMVSSVEFMLQILPRNIAYGLLQACINSRPIYMLRTLHPSLTREFAARFDTVMNNAIATLCDWNDASSRPLLLPAHAITLRGLPQKMGGLSLPRAVDIAYSAYCSSFAISVPHISPMVWNTCIQLNGSEHFLQEITQAFREAVPEFLQFRNGDGTQRIHLQAENEWGTTGTGGLFPARQKYNQLKLHNTTLNYLAPTLPSIPDPTAIGRPVRVAPIIPQPKLDQHSLTYFWHNYNRFRQLEEWKDFPPGYSLHLMANLLSADGAPCPYLSPTGIVSQQLTDREFMRCLRARLLMPMFTNPGGRNPGGGGYGDIKVCRCNKTGPLAPDSPPFHGLVCQKLEQWRTRRHMIVRDWLYNMLKHLLPATSLWKEKMLDFGGARQKQMDIVVEFGNKTYWVDVGITAPHTEDALRMDSHTFGGVSAELMENEKYKKIAVLSNETVARSTLVPFIFETTGRLGKAAEAFLDALLKYRNAGGDASKKMDPAKTVRFYIRAMRRAIILKDTETIDHWLTNLVDTGLSVLPMLGDVQRRSQELQLVAEQNSFAAEEFMSEASATITGTANYWKVLQNGRDVLGDAQRLIANVGPRPAVAAQLDRSMSTREPPPRPAVAALQDCSDSVSDITEEISRPQPQPHSPTRTGTTASRIPVPIGKADREREYAAVALRKAKAIAARLSIGNGGRAAAAVTAVREVEVPRPAAVAVSAPVEVPRPAAVAVSVPVEVEVPRPAAVAKAAAATVSGKSSAVSAAPKRSNGQRAQQILKNASISRSTGVAPLARTGIRGTASRSVAAETAQTAVPASTGQSSSSSPPAPTPPAPSPHREG